MNDHDRMKEAALRVPMVDVIDMCGLGPVNRQKKIPSIYQEERTPSLHVYEYDFFDFSTGQGGNQIRFVMDYFSCSYMKALQFLARGEARWGMDTHKPKPAPKKRTPADLTRIWEEQPLMDDNWKDRAMEVIREKWPTIHLGDLVYQFGSKVVHGAIWTPHYNSDRTLVRGIKSRSLISGKKTAVPGSQFTHHLYYCHGPFSPTPAASIIVEGESDCWVMSKLLKGEHVQVFGLPSGANVWNNAWIEELVGDTVYLALDNDDAGQAATEKIASKLIDEDQNGGDRFKVKVLEVPGGRVAEAAAAGWKPVLD